MQCGHRIVAHLLGAVGLDAVDKAADEHVDGGAGQHLQEDRELGEDAALGQVEGVEELAVVDAAQVVVVGAPQAHERVVEAGRHAPHAM